MRELVKSAKQTRRSKWKENAQYDHRTGKWFDKTTGELVQGGRGQAVIDVLEYDPLNAE
jgi:hypothetical protein